MKPSRVSKLDTGIGVELTCSLYKRMSWAVIHQKCSPYSERQKTGAELVVDSTSAPKLKTFLISFLKMLQDLAASFYLKENKIIAC